MAAEQLISVVTGPQRESSGHVVTELMVDGMTCGNCARHVTEALQGVPGVLGATVSLEGQHATVRWKPDIRPDLSAILNAVKSEGFGAKIAAAKESSDDEGFLAGWQLNLWLGLPVTVVLMVGEWVFGLGAVPWFQWLGFFLAGVVQVFAGAKFYRGAWRQLRAGNSNMDTLVALGSTTAFAYSTWALLSGQHGHVYFMEAAAIISLISLGHWVEARVSLRASSALRKLLGLAPAMGRRRSTDGREVEVPVADLRVGDVAVVRPGDHVPTDGIVLEGNSALDESMLTGESLPSEKSPASAVFAGTVNLNGRLLVRITATGAETALAQIIRAVERAQSSRTEIQRLGDRVSSVFVPVVVAVALAAGIWWGVAPSSARAVHDWAAQFLWSAHVPLGPWAAGCIIAASVLIIACPCAMGLATPAAIMSGSNVAAQRGILIRDGVALEKAGLVTAVVFDKTGTLTVGKPQVVKVWESQLGHVETEAPISTQERKLKSPMQDLSAALARHSAHPLSQAVAKISSSEIPLADWREVHGAGVQGRLNRESATQFGAGPGTTGQNDLPTARLGSLAWLVGSGVDLAAGQSFIEEWSAQGTSLVGLALEKSLLGLFAVKDTVKPGAGAVVEQLTRQGLAIYMVTGDHKLTARSIAQQTGIPPEHVFAEVRPEQKGAFVQKLQRDGQRVAFVGDGINDAPALEQADLGIAVSRASDIAREAADIILLRSDIEAVPESLGLAHATLRTIKQNLFWAFFYNAVGIPLAALGFMSPILCAAAMGLSDLVVIGNALRLRKWRLPGNALGSRVGRS
jgi:Cu+-exporting ATPase